MPVAVAGFAFAANTTIGQDCIDSESCEPVAPHALLLSSDAGNVSWRPELQDDCAENATSTLTEPAEFCADSGTGVGQGLVSPRDLLLVIFRADTMIALEGVRLEASSSDDSLKRQRTH